jgi:hypothetical protein
MNLLLLAAALAFYAYIRHLFIVNHRPDWIVNIFSITSFGLTIFVLILIMAGILP